MPLTPEGSPPTAPLPPILRADLAGPPFDRRSWAWTIGPAYAGVFVWEPFFDRLGTFLTWEALAWLAALSVLAAIACYGLLYLVPALSGWAAGRRLSLVGASTFGTLGSEWITGVAVAFGAIGFYAVSVFMALRLTLLGLISCGLVSPSALEPMSVGPLVLEGPIILLSAMFWMFITVAANGLRLTGVIVALMQVYTPVAILLLGATALLTCSGLPAFPEAVAAIPAAARPTGQGGSGGPVFLQLIFGYFAFSGLSAVDWGMAVLHRRDVRIGGWISVILAGSFGAIVSLLTVAGAVGRMGLGAIDEAGSRIADPLTFHGAVFHGIGGIVGGTILMLFGLASLAPAIYAVFTFSTRLGPHWPSIGRRGWAWLGAMIGFILIAMRLAGRIETIFGLIGAVFAPVVGAMTADWFRRRGEWRGVRAGVSPAGVIAWGLGALIGLAPMLGTALGRGEAAGIQPASLFAYLAAGVTYLILSAIGLESPWTDLPGVGDREPEAVLAPVREAETAPSFEGEDRGAHREDRSSPRQTSSGAQEAGRGSGAN